MGQTETSKVVTTDSSGNVVFNGSVSIADGTNDFDIISHDGNNGLKLGGTLVTATASKLNFLDGSTVGTSTDKAIWF